jgi:2-oxoglutarate ferredoxin oxidoreductase subunit alpha
MNRISLKIVGAQGQGIISIGEILAKALKRSGYCVFGYREYMSLIKGGHGSYQIDASNESVRSTEEQVNVLVALNHHAFEHNLGDLKEGGVIVHDSKVWKFSAENEAYFKKQNIQVICLPMEEMLRTLKAKPILSNVLFAAFVWSAFGGDKALLKQLVGDRFAKKKDLLEQNMQAIDAGFAYRLEQAKNLAVQLPKPDKKWADQLLLTGSQAMALGIVHAGCRLYAGYPMTPSSPLLESIANMQNDTGMVIKQAEDEITAAQMMSGAMHMGTRAITATSGGGFDLMTETVSLDGIIENPSVFVLAQRPGPATGLPTWTAQGDLFLAVRGGHGEFARCVMSVSDSEDSFALMNDAFNIAEQYQTPVIVMTDKQIAEAIYTQKPYAQDAVINRGKLIVKPAELKKLKASDRFDPAVKDGISPRWLPGSSAATYVAQGDEHSADGSVDESVTNAIAQMDKRMKKQEAMKRAIPEPILFGSKNPEVLLVGWGSTKDPVLDVINDMQSVGYLHYTYLWPLKTELFETLAAKTKKVVFIEGNHEGQLETLVRQECGYRAGQHIRKYDGRPFFVNELREKISSHLSR